MMSSGEFNANKKVQGFKDDVDAAERAIDTKFVGISDRRLRDLVDAVNRSIGKRTSLNSLGTDARHPPRILKEQGFLARLRAEQDRRSSEEDEAREARNSAGGGALPGNSNWGGPRK